MSWGVFMNKKYVAIAFLSSITMILLLLILFFVKSNTYITMVSIFIPILVGFMINYDNKQKEIKQMVNKKREISFKLLISLHFFCH